MHRRAVRFLILALLIGAGAGAAFLIQNTDRRLQSLERAEQEVAGRIDQVTAATADIAAAQLAYVAGTPDQAALDQVPALLRIVNADLASLRPTSDAAPAALEAMADILATLGEVDARARENLAFGQEFLAADLVSSAAREGLSAMGMKLGELRAAEAADFGAERRALRQQASVVIASAAAFWALGLFILVRVPQPRTTGQVEPVESTSSLNLFSPAHVKEPAPESGANSLDLAAAAALCTDISRATTTAALSELLARAATLLDARGLIVWMGAGDELFPALTYGYDARVVSRLGSLPRGSDNVTAAAWRTGKPGRVAGDATSNGALVAPMFSPAYCIGVLAVEVRHGREANGATRAVTAMIAAQLATAVVGWPAASTVRETAVG